MRQNQEVIILQKFCFLLVPILIGVTQLNEKSMIYSIFYKISFAISRLFSTMVCSTMFQLRNSYLIKLSFALFYNSSEKFHENIIRYKSKFDAFGLKFGIRDARQIGTRIDNYFELT